MAKAAAKTKPPADKTEAPAVHAAAAGQSDTGTSQPAAGETEGTGGGDAAPAEAPKAKADAKAKTKADVVTVTTNAERGRWRIGRHFSREATVIPAADLTTAQLEALQGDPVLVVTIGPAAIE